MSSDLIKNLWQEAVKIDVIDQESAQLFRKKTKRFIDFFVKQISNENDYFIDINSRVFFIDEKSFYEFWVVSDAKALFFLEGEKFKTSNSKEFLSLFDEYNDFIELWGKIPEAYYEHPDYLEEHTNSSPASPFCSSFVGDYFFQTIIENPIEDYFFDRTEENSELKSSFGFKKKYKDSLIESKLNNLNSLPFSFLSVISERSKLCRKQFYSGTAYYGKGENPVFDSISKLIEKEDLMKLNCRIDENMIKKGMRF